MSQSRIFISLADNDLMARSKKSAKHASLVPVLFTLGVIGWGFFAIDRLTSSAAPDYLYKPLEAHDYSGLNQGPEKSWKKTAEEFLKKFSHKPARNSISRKPRQPERDEFEQWTAAQEESRDDESLSRSDSRKDYQKDYQVQNTSHEYSLYYYTEKRGKLRLVRLVSEIRQGNALKEVFSRIIAGPKHRKGQRQDGLIDSFPLKPTVNDAYIRGPILTLDLDDNFGNGVGFETAELQIQQLMKTAAQFSSVKSIQFLINGEKVKTIQVDGLTIPSMVQIGAPVVVVKEPES